MDCNTFAHLTNFRQQLYACFRKAGDALFNCIDALLSETPARSLAELSLSPFFVRQWPSVYQALQKACLDRVALQRLFCAYVALPDPGERLVLGIDASSIARPCSPTAHDRTYVHQSNLPKGSKPVRPGWQFSTLTVLPQTPSSWTYVLDNVRVPSEQTQGEAAALQLQAALPHLPTRPLLLGDGYYGSVTFLLLLADCPVDVLLRFAKNRVVFRPPPPRTGKPGAPKKDGARFACHEESHPRPARRLLAGPHPRRANRAGECVASSALQEGAGADGERTAHRASAGHQQRTRPAYQLVLMAWANTCPRWRWWPICTAGATVRNTVTEWTSRPCCGKRRVCARLSSFRRGQTSWRVRVICCFSPARSPKPRVSRGRAKHGK